jgi:hypothetical protein
MNYSKKIKLVWSFTPGGTTDVAAVCDNNLVEQEKIKVREKYRDHFNKNVDKWSKAPKKGGYREDTRRKYLVQWIQEANKEFVRDNAKRIKKSFQQCAFLNNVDGSDDKLIDLRAGSENIDMAKEYFPISQFAKTDVSMDCLEPDLTVQELLDELDNQADSDKEKDEVVSKATDNVEAIVKRRQRKKRFEMTKQKRRELRKIPKKVQQCQSIGNHENKNGKRKNIGKSNILDIVPKIIKSRKRNANQNP